MEDHQILDLYFQRSEQAIQETDTKYGNYCFRIAYQILASREDAQESVSDTYLAAWNAIPPKRPPLLSAFLGKITRNVSIDRWRTRSAYKRGGGEFSLCLEELTNCTSGQPSVEDQQIQKEVVQTLNVFLKQLPETERKVFVCRYWYMDSIRDISEDFGISQTRVTTMLHRTREKLQKQLKKEGLL